MYFNVCDTTILCNRQYTDNYNHESNTADSYCLMLHTPCPGYKIRKTPVQKLEKKIRIEIRKKLEKPQYNNYDDLNEDTIIIDIT